MSLHEIWRRFSCWEQFDPTLKSNIKGHIWQKKQSEFKNEQFHEDDFRGESDHINESVNSLKILVLYYWFWHEQHEWEAKNEKQKISDTENTADVFYAIKMKNTKPGTSNRNVVTESILTFVFPRNSTRVSGLTPVQSFGLCGIKISEENSWNTKVTQLFLFRSFRSWKFQPSAVRRRWSHLADIQKYTDAASINQNHHA